MKRLLAIVTIAAFTACGGAESNDYNSSEDLKDTTTMSSQAKDMNTSDIQNRNLDTTDLGGGPRGDSSSASGIHGAGSGSRVGGGVSGGAQGKKAGEKKQ